MGCRSWGRQEEPRARLWPASPTVPPAPGGTPPRRLGQHWAQLRGRVNSYYTCGKNETLENTRRGIRAWDEARTSPARPGLATPKQGLRGDHSHTTWDGDRSAGARGGVEIRYPKSNSRALISCRDRIPALPYLPPGPGAERDPPWPGAHVPQALGCCISQHLETLQPS